MNTEFDLFGSVEIYPYLLFAGDTYYPGGGYNDYLGEFPTEKKAREAGSGFDWWQIVHKGRIISWSN